LANGRAIYHGGDGMAAARAYGQASGAGREWAGAWRSLYWTRMHYSLAWRRAGAGDVAFCLLGNAGAIAKRAGVAAAATAAKAVA